MARLRTRWLALSAVLVLLLTLLPTAASSQAQGGSRTFPETGKTVSGRFLEYWNTHGALAQQGYPISEAAQETNATDGKVYLTQYFERSVFEAHPEFAAPNDVLLSLLGVFFYQGKYPSGAPGQVASAENPFLFPQTGKHVGGIFRTYWETHGGLAQQGYPISEEFNEVSATNGQTYRVQYFERAVFEMHPENPAPYNVLLSLLGKFRYDVVHGGGGGGGGGGGNPTNTPVVLPTNTPTPIPPTNTPVPPTNTPNPCSGIPDNIDMQVLPRNCGPGGSFFIFVGRNFQPGENVGVYVTAPDQSVFGAPFQTTADAQGVPESVSFQTLPGFPLGVWAMTMEGTTSHHRAIGYFKLTP